MSDKNVDHVSGNVQKVSPGPHLAKIVSHLDPSYMGALDVRLLRAVGNSEDASQLHTVKYMSPFYGSTSVDFVKGTEDTYDNTQKTYGMWMIPPDVGTTVMVIFVDGDPRKGYWFGCIPDEGVNFMVPGNPATKYVVDGNGDRVPVAEYNKEANTQVTDITKIQKPRHPFADVLEAQGLLKDDVRGITTSGARRDLPSAVFGISTPGPVDKRPGAPKGRVGKENNKVNAFVSRLGGSSFVMDDGDDKFIRMTPAHQGPPEYEAIEQLSEDTPTTGKPEIPHNECVRIRTRTGHQILLHNSEDLIYIGNARGTAWVELTSLGKIDIYAADSISIHTKNDLNITADRDINLTAGRNINLNAGTNFNATAGTNYEIKAGTDGKLTVGGTSHIKAGTAHRETAGRIDMNGPAAASAAVAPKATRIPQVEPWIGHENLNPLFTMPDSTEAATTAPAASSPKYYKNYTTETDTFEQIKPPENKK